MGSSDYFSRILSPRPPEDQALHPCTIGHARYILAFALRAARLQRFGASHRVGRLASRSLHQLRHPPALAASTRPFDRCHGRHRLTLLSAGGSPWWSLTVPLVRSAIRRSKRAVSASCRRRHPPAQAPLPKLGEQLVDDPLRGQDALGVSTCTTTVAAATTYLRQLLLRCRGWKHVRDPRMPPHRSALLDQSAAWPTAAARCRCATSRRRAATYVARATPASCTTARRTVVAASASSRAARAGR